MSVLAARHIDLRIVPYFLNFLRKPPSDSLKPWSKKKNLPSADTHQNLSSPIKTVTSIRNSSGTWARSDEDRAETFAQHIRNVFQPNSATNSFDLPPLRTEIARELSFVWTREIVNVMKIQLKPKKAPGGDLTTPKMIIELLNVQWCLYANYLTGSQNLGTFQQKTSIRPSLAWRL